ncbi:hypothetical protein [Sphingobacterium sp. GVS05A]|uniref:hypothetical protein n=1 Tax=Sphingobacterium sp. GVS05A TaxID=2862679 RepID=UPI001CBCFC95|nr:hypothetical protein [Sphingobacterium sp. GVS05A]
MKKLLLMVMVLGCSENQGDRNYDNLKKIELGMHYDKVVDIMGGATDSIDFEGDTLRFNLKYKSAVGSSDDYFIFFSKKDNLVIAIGDGQ